MVIFLVKKLTNVFWVGIVGLLLVLNAFYVLGSNTSENNNVEYKQTTTRPVFEGLSQDSNGSIIVLRDNTNHQGAVILANKGDNVTVIYSFTGGTNETLPLIFGDDGDSGNGLSWTEPTPMIYDFERTNQSTTGDAFYNFTFHVNSDFIVFLVRLNNYEDDYRIPNIITTGVRIESELLEEFYTNFDQIGVNLTLYNYNITEYGLQYRVDNANHDNEFSNVTIPYNGSGDNDTLTATISETFPEGTTLEIRAFIRYFDNITQEYRYYHDNKAHLVTIIDGTPTITVNAPRYTNKFNVSISWSAEAPKGNITEAKIDWGDGSAEQTITNVSITEAFHVYADEGEYNITLKIFAGTAYGTKNAIVLIDQQMPTGTITIKDNVTTIVSGLRKVTFVISATDNAGGSGLEKFVVETDEGNVFEFDPSETEVTLEFLNFGPHTVNLTIYDKAGNTYTTSVSFILENNTIPQDSPVPFPFGLTSIVGLVALSVVLLRRRH